MIHEQATKLLGPRVTIIRAARTVGRKPWAISEAFSGWLFLWTLHRAGQSPIEKFHFLNGARTRASAIESAECWLAEYHNEYPRSILIGAVEFSRGVVVNANPSHTTRSAL